MRLIEICRTGNGATVLLWPEGNTDCDGDEQKKEEKMKKFMVFLCTMFIGCAHADTETINWYVDDSVYDTTTCQSGGDIVAPQTNPTKYGYTFDGWEIALYDFSTFDSSRATDRNWNESEHTWISSFPYGHISGVSLCSVTAGSSIGAKGTPDENTTGGQYCWCKATGYKPRDSNIVYEPNKILPWVFATNLGAECASKCAYYCASYPMYYTGFNSSLFGN